jgi:hypothetical protein
MQRVFATVIYGFSGQLEGRGSCCIGVNQRAIGHGSEAVPTMTEKEMLNAIDEAVGVARLSAKSFCDAAIESNYSNFQPMPNGVSTVDYIKAMCGTISVSTFFAVTDA